MLAMQIKNVGVADLKAYKLNAKKHPESQIEGIAESIKRFGFTQPLVINKKNEIIIGHGRLEAAKKIGMKEVPLYLPENIITNFCPRGGSVIDSFGGTGTTLIACEKTNRRCFMMELDEKYCDVIVKRWQDFTGKEAKLMDKKNDKAEAKRIA